MEWCSEKGRSAYVFDFIDPHLEIDEFVLTETVGQWHISSIAPTGNKHPPKANIVVARIKHPPSATKITSIQAAKSIGG